MLMMTDLEEVGTPIDPAHPMYCELHDDIRLDRNPTTIAQVKRQAHGIVMHLSENKRKLYEFPETAHAVLWWTDGDETEDNSGLNLVTEDEVNELAAASTQTMIDRIVAHYDANPRDDGHPAFALFQQQRSRSTADPG